MEIVLFHIRTKPDVDQAAYQKAFERMLELVSEMPGFAGLEGFAGEDGSELAVARFESREAIEAWYMQPEHVETQERGRTEFFDSYDITIATTWKQYSWPKSSSS